MVEEDRKIEHALRATAAMIPEVLDVHEIAVSRGGEHIYLSCHCTLSDELPMLMVHEVITALEDRFKLECPEVYRVTIHPRAEDQQPAVKARRKEATPAAQIETAMPPLPGAKSGASYTLRMNPVRSSDVRSITTLSSREVYRNHWMRLREDEILRSNGQKGIYGVVEKDDAAIILPVDQGRVWLVEQFRYTIQERALELPQGGWEMEVEIPRSWPAAN